MVIGVGRGSLLLAAAILFTVRASADEVFTCRGTAGERVYQDTSCADAATETRVDDGHGSFSSPSLPPAELEHLSRILRERARKREADARARDRAIDDMVRRHLRKAANCTDAKKEYHDALVERRRHGRLTDQVEDASRRMHEACSD